MLYRPFFTVLGVAVTAATLGAIALLFFAPLQSDTHARAYAAQTLATPAPATPIPTVNTTAPFTGPRPRPAARVKGKHLRGIIGTVVNVNERALTVQRAPQTIPLDPDTKIIVAGKPNAQLQDIQVGDKLLAPGARANGARWMLVVPATTTRDLIRIGRVTATHTDYFTLRTPRGALDVTIDNATQILDTHAQSVTVEALQNKIVLVIGAPSGDSMRAQVVLTRASP